MRVLAMRVLAMRVLALLLALAALGASVQAQVAPPGEPGRGVLVVQPAPALAFDAGLGAPGAEALATRTEPASMPGPRGRGACRGARTGFLVGAAASAAVVGVTALLDLGQGGCEYVCTWQVAALLAVPFMALTTATGATIGAATAQPDRPAAPVPQP